jgi:hypothetical protein
MKPDAQGHLVAPPPPPPGTVMEEIPEDAPYE